MSTIIYTLSGDSGEAQVLVVRGNKAGPQHRTRQCLFGKAWLVCKYIACCPAFACIDKNSGAAPLTAVGRSIHWDGQACGPESVGIHRRGAAHHEIGWQPKDSEWRPVVWGGVCRGRSHSIHIFHSPSYILPKTVFLHQCQRSWDFASYHNFQPT